MTNDASNTRVIVVIYNALMKTTGEVYNKGTRGTALNMRKT